MKSPVPQYLFVGSSNPVKLEAVHLATKNHWPNLEVCGFAVDTSVSEQPLSDKETRLGSRHRAKEALRIGLVDENNQSSICLGIGMEGGVYRRARKWWNVVWVCVTDSLESSASIFESSGAHFELPDEVGYYLSKGIEMGEIFSQLTGGEDIRHSIGAVGVLTRRFLIRSEEYASIAKVAIGLWYGRGWQS